MFFSVFSVIQGSASPAIDEAAELAAACTSVGEHLKSGGGLTEKSQNKCGPTGLRRPDGLRERAGGGMREKYFKGRPAPLSGNPSTGCGGLGDPGEEDKKEDA